MALNNIIAPRQAVQNRQGKPVAGGQVFLYEPGTTTFITAYSSPDLVTPLTQPIRLSGSGRSNIWITRNCDMVITDRQGNTVLTEDDANPDALGGEQSGGLVANGSFEVVTTPPVPDSWAAVNEAGSTNAVDNTESTDGLNSYRFTSSGVGGGSLTSQDFFPVNAVDQLRVNFDLFSTVAAVQNIVRVEWYDVTFISISNTDVYDSTANPAAWTEFNLVATPPALARFAKIKLIGIDPGVPLAGITYFDRISAFYPTVVSGIFDNITIQDNEIISTNLNGEIALKPNGAGPVNIFSTGVVDLTDVENPLNISNLLDPASNPHLAFDADQIQAKADDTNAATLNINPLGGIVNLYANAFLRLVTLAGGLVAIRSDADTDAEQRRLLFQHQDGTDRAWIGHNGDDVLVIVNSIDSGLVRLHGRNSGSALRALIEGDPDTAVDIYHPLSDAVVARTLTPAAGGLSANNTLTGAGLERVLTESDISAAPSYVEQSSDDSVNNSTSLVPSELVLTNVPTGHYRIDLVISARDVSVTGCGMRVQLAFTGAGTSNPMHGTLKRFAGSGTLDTNIQGAVSALFQFPLLNTGSSSTEFIMVGYCDIISGTNSITVEFAQDTAQVGQLDFEENSFMAMTRLGST